MRASAVDIANFKPSSSLWVKLTVRAELRDKHLSLAVVN